MAVDMTGRRVGTQALKERLAVSPREVARWTKVRAQTCPQKSRGISTADSAVNGDTLAGRPFPIRLSIRAARVSLSSYPALRVSRSVAGPGFRSPPCMYLYVCYRDASPDQPN